MHYKDTIEKAQKAKRMLERGKARKEVREHFGIGTMTLWRWMKMVNGPIEPSRRTYETNTAK